MIYKVSSSSGLSAALYQLSAGFVLRASQGWRFHSLSGKFIQWFPEKVICEEVGIKWLLQSVLHGHCRTKDLCLSMGGLQGFVECGWLTSKVWQDKAYTISPSSILSMSETFSSPYFRYGKVWVLSLRSSHKLLLPSVEKYVQTVICLILR